MKYEQILQESESFLFGDGQRYETREEALKATENAMQKVKAELAMQRMYDKAETEIIELRHGYKIAIVLSIPKFV